MPCAIPRCFALSVGLGPSNRNKERGEQQMC